MRFRQQNIAATTVLCASVVVSAFSLLYVVGFAHERVHQAYSQPSRFALLPGQEMEKAVSPNGVYTAVLYTSDGAGVSPAGSTVTLQSVLPAGSPSGPVAVAFTPLETLPFQGICSLNWKGSHLLEIEHYSDLVTSKTSWRSVRIQFKHLDAAAEMP